MEGARTGDQAVKGKGPGRGFCGSKLSAMMAWAMGLHSAGAAGSFAAPADKQHGQRRAQRRRESWRP